MRIIINHIPRYDDYGEMPSNENLLLFFYAGRPLSKKCKGGKILDKNRMQICM